MIDRHIAKLRARDDLSEEEEQAIRDAVADVIDLPADKVFIRAGELLNHSTILLDGIACRYKDLRNGERQITELHVAGDFLDLHSFTLKRLDHHVMALTRGTAAIVPHDRLKEITERLPHLARIYWFSTNMDAAIHREWAVSLGRRTAIARLAHLFCELHVRLGIVGLADEGGYDFKVTQTDLAECLGLTAVHINRTLKDLREQGLVEFRSGRVEIADRAALQQIAEFSPAYLYLDKRPR
jgi:CRP-like cAMP-binding protein